MLEEFACGMDGTALLHMQSPRSNKGKRGRGRSGDQFADPDAGHDDLSFNLPDCSLDEAAEGDLSVIKGPWSAPEDALLRTLVEEHGPKRWSMIAAKLPGRIGKQA